VRDAAAASARAGSLALASALSIGALALAGHLPAAFGDRSLIGSCALPWLVLAGLPLRAREQPSAAPASARASVLAALLALGPVLVALRIESARAVELRWPLAHAAAAWLAVFALEQIAHAAARGGARARAVHALAWCALVPGLPWLAWSFELGGSPAPAAVRELARASPLRLGWSAPIESALALALPLALLALAYAAQRAWPRARLARTLALVALSCALGASSASASPALVGEPRVAWARVAIEGPLSELALESEGVRTVLVHEWLAGEAEELELPLGAGAAAPSSSELARAAPRIASTGAGRARFLAWSEQRAAAWSTLPVGLRARAAPPLEGSRVRASNAALCALAALACALLALRCKPRASLALAVLGALLAAALPLAGARGAALRVIELQQPPAVWLERRAALGELVFPLDAWVRFEVEPAQAPCELVLERGGSADDSLGATRAWTVRARAAADARLDAWHVHAPSGEVVLDAWDELWLRSPDGAWRSAPELGARAGASARARTDSPPGWLAAGLPQGRSVLLGYAVAAPPGTPPETHGGGLPQGEHWLRWVGFEPP